MQACAPNLFSTFCVTTGVATKRTFDLTIPNSNFISSFNGDIDGNDITFNRMNTEIVTNTHNHFYSYSYPTGS